MSQLRPSININPTYATNNIDNGQAGWYQITPNASNLALRVGTSNIGITGEIYFNSSNATPVFQGYDGSQWVDFNATVGPQGPPGLDFTNAVNFNNLGANTAPGVIVTRGEIFESTFVDVSASISNVNLRTLESGSHTVNSNLAIQSMTFSQNSNVITMTNNPLPYTWDFSTTVNNNLDYLKNSSSDSNYFSWGDTSRWIVKTGSSITKGQAVRLTNDSPSSNIVITPVTYTSLIGIDPFNTPFNMLGIATQTVTSGQTCNVCVKGITTVLCTNDVNPSEFIRSDSVPNVGLDGIVGKDGGIFRNTTPSPTVTYIRAGYFLESGASVGANGNYALFYVDPQVRIF
jgi:hypothetical protein